ncbi:hypothetical protein J7K50_02175 [bacterium]|nr:hypothetical protein [bacterium]
MTKIERDGIILELPLILDRKQAEWLMKELENSVEIRDKLVEAGEKTGITGQGKYYRFTLEEQTSQQ